MAVEPTNENKDAAEPQNPAPGPMLTDEDLESPSKKRKVCCKSICTLMCMFSIVPNMCTEWVTLGTFRRESFHRTVRRAIAHFVKISLVTDTVYAPY